MGFMTLAALRNDLQAALGDKGIENPRLDRWINTGYLEVAGAIDFEELDAEEVIAAATGGVLTLTAGTRPLVVKMVRNTTDNELLRWVPKFEFFRRDLTETGLPKVWTRHKEEILILPLISGGTKSMRVIFKNSPVLLTETTDVTVLPDTWDPAVYMLAVHHGLLNLAEEQRASVWLQRAVAYIQTRMTEAGLHEATSGLGPSIASPTTMRMAAPGGQ